jgi:hypothetical protein
VRTHLQVQVRQAMSFVVTHHLWLLLRPPLPPPPLMLLLLPLLLLPLLLPLLPPQVKAGQAKLFGFGHPVYKNFDPRSTTLRKVRHVCLLNGRRCGGAWGIPIVTHTPSLNLRGC